jgi:hypothetical protein
MTNDPFAGRDIRAPERCRMLVATEDGVFLWPGSALVYRRGNGFFTMDPREVNSELGAFFGPAALATPILTVLEIARDQLREGRTATVQCMLDRLPLPSLSPNGVRLTRAIAKRQRLALPDVASATELTGTVWTDSDVEIFAKLHDDLKPRAHALEKVFNPGSAWDPAKHPRWPSGESDGGQFRPGDGAGDGGASPIRPVSAAGQIIARQLLGDPPKIPTETPATNTAKNVVRKAVAHWLVRAVLIGADITAPEIVVPVQAAVEGAFWLAPYVNAYLDKPKTLEELQAAVKNPRDGTDVHHIVEQTPARKDKFPESQIEDPSNLARIPTLKHWELNAWYEKSNENYAGQTPRQYVKGKDWATRRKVGLDGLKAVGVLQK